MTSKPHILLAGGGHANVLALLILSGRCRLTLVSENNSTPYSGMLPGYISGQYSKPECFINLKKTCEQHGVEWIQGKIVGIKNKELILADNRKVNFDVLSLNIGGYYHKLFDAENSCAVKPIDHFLQWLDELESSNLNNSHIAVVGGGAGGVETVLALFSYWKRKNKKLQLSLISSRFLFNYPDQMRNCLKRILNEKQIDLKETRALNYDNKYIYLSDKQKQAADYVIYVSGISPPLVLQNCSLDLDDDYFAKVNSKLQSVNNPCIFITGDSASHSKFISKSGVMAVRQAPVLAHNLLVQSGMSSSSLRSWNANNNALFIISCGDGKAVATRNGWTFEGRWVQWWKNYLDQKFMAKFPNH